MGEFHAPTATDQPFETMHDDSIYTAATPEPETTRTSYNSHHFSSSSPQYSRQSANAGLGCVGVLLGGCAAMCVILVGGFVLLAVIVGGITTSFGELANTTLDDSLTERFVSGNRQASNKVAILTIDGIITGAEDGFVAKQVRQIIKDENVKAVVLRVDSPGGTMSGSDYFHHLLTKMKRERDGLPIIVSMGSIAASGGYYVAVAGDEIFAERSTITGSIGVVVPMFKAIELSRKIGVESTPITSGPLKSMGSIMQPMSDEEKVVWERLIDDNFQRFKEVIREGRKAFAENPENLDKLATGQIFTATEAEANHLIDRVGFLDDAVAAAMNRAGLDERTSKTVKYRPKLRFMDILLESRSPDNILGTKTLVDLTTPRIYLLCPHVLPIHGETSDKR